MPRWTDLSKRKKRTRKRLSEKEFKRALELYGLEEVQDIGTYEEEPIEDDGQR